MNCIGKKRLDSHILDASESKRMKKTDRLHSINYIISVPSLQNITILKVATGLWKQSDITEAMHRRAKSSSPFNKYEDDILQLRKSALKKMSLLPLPNLLKEEVANVIKPLLLRIFEWMHHEYKLDWDKIPSVYWTTKGDIDKGKTLNEIIHSNLKLEDICHLFKLACKYCLEDSIAYLWDKLLKSEDPNIIERMEEGDESYDDHFVIFWICILKKKFFEINTKLQRIDFDDIYEGCDNVYKNMFRLATKTGIIEAVEYFFNKFATEEMSHNLVSWIECVINHVDLHHLYVLFKGFYGYSDVLYFLLSQMDDIAQQREVFVERSDVILSSLFKHWSLRKFLLPTIRTIWSSLDETVYVEFLNEVAGDIADDRSAHKLLRKLWLESPKTLKKHFISCATNYNEENHSNVIHDLLKVEDVETIKLILNFADVGEKKDIIFSLIDRDTLNMEEENGVFLFDTLTNETLSSYDIKELKEKIVQYSRHFNASFHMWINDDDKVR